MDIQDARVDEEAVRATMPIVGISIPGQAFVGWIAELIPQRGSQAEHHKGNRELPGQFSLSKSSRDMHRVKNVQQMFDRLALMYASPAEGGIVFYKQIREKKVVAMKAEKCETGEGQGTES